MNRIDIQHEAAFANMRIIAADLPLLSTQYPIKELLSSFRVLVKNQPDVRLILAGKRHPEENFSVWNYLDDNNLVGLVDFLPYYNSCDRFPIKKPDCDVWISRVTPSRELTSSYLGKRLNGELPSSSKYALFFTCFHPGKDEGNSRLMRIWLEHLKLSGYKVHVLYYMYDRKDVTPEMRRGAQREFDLYQEIEVTSRLTGSNCNGLNVHVDDWCGPEALAAVTSVTSKYEYDVAITNYPFMTAVLDRAAAYTRKILLTHDSFTDRNRRMLSQGYKEASWICPLSYR